MHKYLADGAAKNSLSYDHTGMDGSQKGLGGAGPNGGSAVCSVTLREGMVSFPYLCYTGSFAQLGCPGISNAQWVGQSM